VILSRSQDQDLTVEKDRGGDRLTGLGLRLAAGEERHWRWSSVMFLVVPELMDT
jgi:hypothetical protein